jgi:gliding motility-associated-like protein
MKNKFSNILILILLSSFLHAQTLVNNGAKLYLQSGVNLYIGGNFVNLTDNNQSNGTMDLHGTIVLNKDWINDADSGEVFVNIENPADGMVKMESPIEQNIQGTAPTNFENLSLANSNKTLNISNCKVNGILSLDAILKLNKQRLIINNSSSAAIDYKGGYIESETTSTEGIGEIQWMIGNSTDLYNVPFGSKNADTNNLNLSLEISSPGSSEGSITFATYPTDNYLMFPYPSSVQNLNGLDAKSIINRFWIIRPEYALKPDINLIFSYLQKDIDQLYANFKDINLQARRYNTDKQSWTDIDAMGYNDANNLKVIVNNIQSNDFYEPWILLSDKKLSTIYIPNAFSPGNDGKNDTFIPKSISINPSSFEMHIYNRWGAEIYSTTDINKPWDGRVKGKSEICPIGVYVYYIVYRDIVTRQFNECFGTISIVK